jgi:hypothetical protein
MEVHKANLEVAQPLVTNSAIPISQMIPQLHPMVMASLPQIPNPMTAIVGGQANPSTPISNVSSVPLQTHGMLPATNTQQQLVNGHCMTNKTNTTNNQQVNSCYTFANCNTTNTPGNTVMSVNNLATALPFACFFPKPSAYTQAVIHAHAQHQQGVGGSQSSIISCGGGCTTTTTTVSPASQSLSNAQHHAAAMLGLHALTTQHLLPVSSGTPPNPNHITNSYHVTPKLKTPAGLITVSSGRGTDKFSPY